MLPINIHELTAALPVSRKEYCWPANEPLRGVRNPLVRIWWLHLRVACWGELASHVCWDLASCECTHWGENISRGGVGSRGRGSLTNITSCKTKRSDLHLTPGCLHSCSINLLNVFLPILINLTKIKKRNLCIYKILLTCSVKFGTQL